MKREQSPILRVLLYILHVLVYLGLIAFFCWFCFREANNVSALIVITNEGLSARANMIINTQESTAADYDMLGQYFSSEAVISDQLIQEDPYQNYIVTNFDYTAKIEKIQVWPWSKTATVRVKEITSLIEGRMEDSFSEETAIPKVPPKWEDRVYDVKFFKNEEGRWYIKKLIEIEEEKSEQK